MTIFKRLDFWLGAGFILVFGFILPFVPIVDGDTFYYLGKARRILETGDLFNSNILTTKPVLGMWAMALSLKIRGWNLGGVYLWHTLCGAGVVGLLYAFAKKHFDPKTALYSAAVLLTALMFFYQVSSPMLDIPMLFFLLLGQILALEYLLTDKPGYLYGLGAAAGLGFLTKGLLPAALPFLTGGLYLLLAKWGRHNSPVLTRPAGQIPRLILTGLLFITICSSWLIPQWQIHGPEFGQALYRENIERFFHPIDETGGYREVSSGTQFDPQLNLLYLWLGFLPWSPLIIPAVHAAGKNNYFQKKPEIFFLLCWFGLVLLLTSLSGHYKGPRYLLPLFPPLSMLCGVLLARGKALAYPRLIPWSFRITGLVLLFLLGALPFIRYTHGEAVYLPVVLPFLFCFTVCLLGSCRSFRQNGRPDFTIYTVLVSYVVLFTCAAVFLPGVQFPEKYVNPQQRILR
ncbi:MAG: glycosyltransferase family 39 protein [Candidatus Margulisbacteria bacterium]|jgi:4-amino-4-deoxy-L-arabinose transferase-like glycosyltransferase|nr:glycosyltransferase family 39 protein [Candidatus Margulisiibacteriota bacterium]